MITDDRYVSMLLSNDLILHFYDPSILVGKCYEYL